MALTALNRTMVALLTNNSGASVAQGDVVIVDSASASAFTTTTTSAYASGSVGVVLEPNGIASGATGIVAFGGYVPKVNLSTAATLAQMIRTSTTAKQANPHSSPIVAGDFGQVLGTGTSPAAFLFAQPTAAASGGSLTLAGDSDVSISSPAAGQGLVYDSVSGLWKNKGDSSWITPTFTNSWVNFGSPFANVVYRKDANGFVHLRGAAKSGTAATSIFTLPAGYRPASQLRFTQAMAASAGYVDVHSDGTVVPSSPLTGSGSDSDWTMLDGMTFYGDQ